jgi:hypothetical protein
MKETLRAIAIVVCTASVTAITALAADVPIPGKVAVVKSGKLAKVVSKATTPFPLPAPGSAADPTQSGAALTFFDTDFPGAGSVTFTLDKTGWLGLGKPAGSKGYKYKGKDDVEDSDPKGTCKSVLLKDSVIKAVCKGTAVILTTPFVGAAGVTLGLPAGSVASTRYCAEIGGDEIKNDGKLMKRKDAPAPVSCPEVSVVGFDPNDLITLADDSFGGRPNDTVFSTMAQDFLIDALEPIAEGLNSAQIGDDAFKQAFTLGTNILAVIPGGELPDEYVMVGAHYDHLGSSCPSSVMGDTVCNGATDNAAGVAAVLAIGRAVASQPNPPRRSVILALWDREEDGLLGSLFYVQNPLVPLASTIAYVNFDIQGANLLPSLKNFSAAVSAETGGSELRGLVDDAISGEGLGTRKLSHIFGQLRSDYANLVSGGVPSVFFSDSTGGCYHTKQDEVSVVDFGKLETQTKIGLKLTLSLIETDTPPPFVAPSAPLAKFEDATVINDVLNDAIVDLALFAPADQATILQFQSDLNAIVADGAGNFDSADVTTLLLGTIDVVDILTNIPCDGFL